MFDIGWSELLVVAVVAIIFIGPRELIPMLRAFGKYAGKLKRMAAEFQSQFNEALREVELDQITKEVEEIRKISPVGDIKKELEAEMKPIGAAVGDIAKPIEAPAKGTATAEDKAAAKTAGSKPEKAAAKPAKPKTRSAAKPAPKPASELAPKPAAKPAPKRAAGGDGS
jgi:sec-independent protein translocase protein TatB